MNKEFFYKKSLGQNFLCDPKILKYISSLCSGKVIEIGAGQGALTKYLIEKCNKVIALEVDDRCSDALYELQSQHSNFEWILGNILKFSWDQVPAEINMIVGNLPYNIATKIILDICQQKRKHCVFTIQEELSQRIAAKTSAHFYSALSVIIQTYYVVKIHKKISPGCFYPPPKIWSRVIELKPQNTEIEFLQLSHVLGIAFSCRRKMLRNTLIKHYPFLGNIIDTTKRAQDISLEGYHEITKRVFERIIYDGKYTIAS